MDGLWMISVDEGVGMKERGLVSSYEGELVWTNNEGIVPRNDG